VSTIERAMPPFPKRDFALGTPG